MLRLHPHRLLPSLLAPALVLTSTASAAVIQFAGYILDTPEWRNVSTPDHPAGPASGFELEGWSLFGRISSGDSPWLQVRPERLPPFVSQVTPHPDAQELSYDTYASIQNPDASANNWVSGTLSLPGEATTQLLRIRLGQELPDRWRLGLLIDNLDAPVYTPKEITLQLGDTISPPVMTTGGAGLANKKPDWYFWDINNAAPGSELVVQVTPGSSVSTLGGIIFLAPPSPRHIGEFRSEGEYMKDYYVLKEDGTYHLFYNVGDAGSTQDWQEPRNEKAFGHATSKDLRNWTHHPRVLDVVPGTWEGQVVSAPSIIKHEGVFHLFYTGFDSAVVGKQAIGLATSPDLFTWTRHPGNPVYEAPAWTMRNASGWLDCRDAHIIRRGDEFLLYTMVTTDKGEGAISLASSKDMKTWKDLGPAFITFNAPESPRVFEHKGVFYMFATSGHGKILVKTRDPKSLNWEPVPFRWPAPGFWSGWEVVQDGERTIFSAFEWKYQGNHIRFWEVDWDGDVPVVRY